MVACGPLAAPAHASADDASRPALPEVVHAPGPWSDDEDVTGPIAAVGLATRMSPEGMFDAHEDLRLFATSAVDGTSSWLELPGFDLDAWGFVGGVTVSPDGRWLGWVRPSGRRIAGWSVMDTSTGAVRRLQVDGQARVRPTVSDLAFSGDSRYLLTSFESPDQPRRSTRAHRFVAWDVTDGTPTVLEEPGHYWLPSLGSAEDGVVWSRKQDVFRADPETGERSSVTLPRTVLMASWAPDDAAFAYIGRGGGDEGLYVGSSPATADRLVDLPETSPIGEFLAWRDRHHVVVGNYRHDVYVVDVRDGSFETIDMAGSGEQLNTPVLATGLWAEPLSAAAAPEGTVDPRQPWRRSGVAVSALLLVVGGISIRRRRPRGPAPSSRTPGNRSW